MSLPAEKKLTDRLPRILKSPFLFAFLAGLYPVAFKASKNLFILRDADPGQIAVLFAIPPLLVLSTAICSYGIVALLRTLLEKVGLRPRLLSDREGSKITLCIVVASAFMILFLDIAVKNTSLLLTGIEFKYLEIFLVSCITLVPLVVFYARRVGTQYLNYVLIAMVVFTQAELSFNLTFGQADVQETADIQSTRTKAASIRFKSKPNVYLILLDAYTNDAVLKKIFKTDNRAFRNELQNKGFHLYDNAYSNYAGTLPSMQSMFSMQHHYYKQAAGVFDSSVARRIISANAYNPVLDIFKRNGYAVRYIHDTAYACPQPGKAIDRFTFYKASPLIYQFFPEFSALRNKIKGYLLNHKVAVNDQFVDNKRLKDIESAFQSGGPFFMYIHTFKPGHAPLFHYNKLEYFEREYPLRIQKANAVAIDMLDLIVAKDPGALIIVMGDHGPFRYGDLWKKSRGAEDQLDGVAKADLGMDLFGIMMAVRYPRGYDKHFDDAVITPVNLFRYVFAELSGNDAVLNDKVRNESYASVPKSHLFIAAKDGRPLERWTVFSNQSAVGSNGAVSKK